jgi:hypothetical protein
VPMPWNATDDYEKTKVIIQYSAANSTFESGFLTFGARMYRPAVSRVKEYEMRG